MNITADAKFVTDVRRLFDAVCLVRAAYVSRNGREPLNFNDAEKRSGTRVLLSVPVTLSGARIVADAVELLEDTITARTVDLGARGLAFRCSNHAISSKIYAAMIGLPNADPVRFVVEVLSIREERSGDLRCGSRFLGLID